MHEAGGRAREDYQPHCGARLGERPAAGQAAEPPCCLVASLESSPHVSTGSHVPIAGDARPEVFSDYYQLGGNDESDEAELEPFQQRELKGYTEAPHSPFGLVWQVATATGWSINYILWKVPYPMLLLMAKDAPRYVSVEEQKKRQYEKLMKKMQRDSVVSKDPVTFFQTHISAD